MRVYYLADGLLNDHEQVGKPILHLRLISYQHIIFRRATTLCYNIWELLQSHWEQKSSAWVGCAHPPFTCASVPPAHAALTFRQPPATKGELERKAVWPVNGTASFLWTSSGCSEPHPSGHTQHTLPWSSLNYLHTGHLMVTHLKK